MSCESPHRERNQPRELSFQNALRPSDSSCAENGVFARAGERGVAKQRSMSCVSWFGPRLYEESGLDEIASSLSNASRCTHSMSCKTLDVMSPGVVAAPKKRVTWAHSYSDVYVGDNIQKCVVEGGKPSIADGDQEALADSSLVYVTSFLAGDACGDDSISSRQEDVAAPLMLDSSCPKQWRQGELLGSGSFGRVYAAQDVKTGHMFAVKVAHIRPHNGMDSAFCAQLQDELKICRDLRHPHIVSCLGHDYQNGRLEVYFEYVAGGSLRSMLSKFGALPMHLTRKATRGMLEGLEYLHSHQPPVVHRDLKGANVLVDLSFCVKLADFGCAKRGVGTRSFTTLGTLHWMAPEVLESSVGHGRKADIWSLGCVVIEMVTAADPWGKDAFRNMMHAMHVIRSPGTMPPVPVAFQESTSNSSDEDCCAEAYDFVFRQCLQRDPDVRPSASQLLQHAFARLREEDVSTNCGQDSLPSSVESKVCKVPLISDVVRWHDTFAANLIILLCLLVAASSVARVYCWQ